VKVSMNIVLLELSPSY